MNSQTMSFYSLSLYCSCLWLCLCGTVAGAVIELRDRCQPTSAVVTLDDVALITATTAEEASALRRVELCPAPAPGRQELVTLSEIQQRLRALGHSDAQMSFRGASRIVVLAPVNANLPKPLPRSPARLLPTSQIQQVSAVVPQPTTLPTTRGPSNLLQQQRQQWELRLGDAIRTHISRRYPTLAELHFEVDLSLENLAILTKATVSDIEARGGEVPFERSQHYTIHYLDELAQVQQLTISARAIEPVRIVIAARDLPAGTILQVSHLEVRQQADRKPAAGTLSHPQALLGQRIRRAMKAGTPLMTSDVERMLLVKQGDLITLQVRRSGIMIQMPAKSQGSGVQGETISVTSLDRRETFIARVTGNQLAELMSTVNP